MRIKLWCLGLVVWAVVGCQRKAPGPEECHRLAERWVESVRPVPRDVFGRRRIRLPAADDDEDVVLERTNTCLTTPYDRELIACVDAKHDVVGCYRAFEFRKGAAGLSRE